MSSSISRSTARRLGAVLVTGALVAGLVAAGPSASAAPKPVGVRRVTSSITPSTATTGVGRIATSPVWL